MSKYFTPYPPMKVHSSTPVTIEEAHSIVSRYIKQAESDRSLHPNAILTDDGPTKSLSGGADDSGGSSLVWHNMHRVEAGLRGEYLQSQPLDLLSKTTGGAAAAAAATEDGDAVVPATPTKSRPTTNGTPNGKRKADWQDPDEYRQQQREVEGDVGDRMQGMVQGKEAAANLAPVEAKVDKAERKRSKKERHKAEKKQRAKERQGPAT